MRHSRKRRTFAQRLFPIGLTPFSGSGQPPLYVQRTSRDMPGNSLRSCFHRIICAAFCQFPPVLTGRAFSLRFRALCALRQRRKCRQQGDSEDEAQRERRQSPHVKDRTSAGFHRDSLPTVWCSDVIIWLYSDYNTKLYQFLPPDEKSEEGCCTFCIRKNI